MCGMRPTGMRATTAPRVRSTASTLPPTSLATHSVRPSGAIAMPWEFSPRSIRPVTVRVAASTTDSSFEPVLLA